MSNEIADLLEKMEKLAKKLEQCPDDKSLAYELARLEDRFDFLSIYSNGK